MHDAVNPIAGAGVPQNSRSVSEQKPLQRLGWKELYSGSQLERVWLPSSQESDQQRCDRYPAEHVEIGKREDENLQNGGEQDEEPGTLVNVGHVSRIANTACQARALQTQPRGILTSS
jgi:hypothetical protein